MYAAVYQGGGHIAVVDQPPPALRAGGGLLEVEGCGVCIADGEVVRGLGGPPHRPPIVLGHEILGRVLAAAPDAPDQVRALMGRRVLVDDARPCGTCAFCLRGAPRSCRSPHYGHIPTEPGQSWGGYAEIVTLDARSNLHPIDDAVSVEHATFAFPLASGIEWTHRLVSLRPEDTVAVVGHSRMGVATVAAAALKEPRRIALYGLGNGTAAVRAAATLGADIADPADRPADGFDVVVVVTEATAAEAALGLALAAPLGRIVLASCATDPISVEPESIRKRGLTVRGGRGHSSESLDDAITAVTARAGWLGEEFFERFDLDTTQAALDTMHDETGATYGVHRVVCARHSA